MNIELVNEIRSLVEEYINEVSDDLVNRVKNERMKRFDSAVDRALKVLKDPNSTEEEKDKERIIHDKVLTKVKRNKELVKKRDDNFSKRVENFRNKLLKAGYGNVKKAGEDHSNAVLNQGLRNKLEKSLSVSESCLNDILDLVEGEIIDFQKKRKEKVLDRNAHKMADIFRSGAVKITNTGGLIGDPQAIKRVAEIEKENRDVGLGRKVGLN